MNTSRYLTKSRFKLALECETKLYYTNKKEYCNQKLDDPFLEALANGGFQVGELAKLYYPGGTEIEFGHPDEMVKHTNELLLQKKVIIYEATIRYGKMLVRVDVLVKDGNKIDLIEVKAKSYDGDPGCFLTKKNDKINKDWKDYIYDVAFQKHVMSKAFPEFEITGYLCLADKTKKATVDGLNQNFLLTRDKNGRTKVKVKEGLRKEDLGEEILTTVNVDPVLDRIYNGELFDMKENMSFESWVSYLAENYVNDVKMSSDLGSKCGSCEFKCSDEEEATGKKSGFKECWKEQAGFEDDDFNKPNILDVWMFRGKDKMFQQGKFLMEDLTRDDIGTKVGAENFEPQERMWVQVEKAVSGDKEPLIKKEGLKKEMRKWKYPLHFIDFETSAVAIPFFKGLRPYEGVAFQYSHHVIYEDGTVEHKSEYLNTQQGEFPNFDFVRNLKKDLEKDDGTIFRYHNHENTYLNIILRQLENIDEKSIPDKYELMEWIKTITQEGDDKKTGKPSRSGERNMVDLHEIVKNYYYDPVMGGSTSIKKVLPAVLNSSVYIKKKYSQPVYGAENGIKSINFKNMKWVELDENGNVINPYKLLPALFEGKEQEGLLTGDAKLADGGAAMNAYASMQFAELKESEREELNKALLRYCELDTLAMVMIWEFFNYDVMGNH
jgi:hypothetical protein